MKRLALTAHPAQQAEVMAAVIANHLEDTSYGHICDVRCASSLVANMNGWTLQPPAVAIRDCAYCGTPFRPQRSDGRFCTPRCRWLVAKRAQRGREYLSR